jgi:hypothetical protein
MKIRFQQAAAVAMTLAGMMCSQIAAADTGSDALNRYVQDLRGRLQAIDNGSGWVSTEVDRGAFDRYLAGIGKGAAGPALGDAAAYLATLTARPLRTFNAYLVYLGQRMRVDAGPSGEPLESNNGTASFDRYIEEINYRIQSRYQALEAMDF